MLFDVIVVGGGHAGLEAALAAARVNLKTALITMDLRSVGRLSCNPAFGGPAKGGLVREIDALGGYAGLGADAAAIQCRILGESKGPAARATRNLVDRQTYSRLAQEFIQDVGRITLIEGEVGEFSVKEGVLQSIGLGDGRKFTCGSAVVTGGTFWNGQIYHGLDSTPGGRVGEPPSTLMRKALSSIGHKLGRLSTSTAPRLLSSSVKTEGLTEQPGDSQVRPFSVLSGPPRNLVSCFLTYTNAKTHLIVERNVRSSIIYAEDPVSAGPRYCPSLEDKVKRFPQRERHYVFLEPDGPDLIYPSGLPTGLPPLVQQELINTIPGLENAVVARPGYAIEYDFSDPTDLAPTLESRLVKGLFLAGQINGTSGYEEAGAQGLWAGVGAAMRASGREPFRLERDEALMAVMLDDLTVSGVSEPYRMFTSRAEWRLSLREDNADLRLSPIAQSLGLLDQKRAKALEAKQEAMNRFGAVLEGFKITLEVIKKMAAQTDLSARDCSLAAPVTAAEFLKRPSVGLRHFYGLIDGLAEIDPGAALSLETEIKYEGYLVRQKTEARKAIKRENVEIPKDIDYSKVIGLTGEAIESLSRHKPKLLGQAGRLRGVTPASISAIVIYLKRHSSLTK
ncbi:MAG: tRNA uridine-5-carboxymethylaminomethyl(34) synthesis enzyme MnmG [Deltaproteobacteria bacterium]|nr:tRNA uridine-5-carboxymethylaminomethyl(34) synthesis enzyme MnmG [Deltaproteobacteria bacterium]